MPGFFTLAFVQSALKRAALWILRTLFGKLLDDTNTSQGNATNTTSPSKPDEPTATLNVPQTVQAADAATTVTADAGIAVVNAEHTKTTEDLAVKRAEIAGSTLDQLATEMNTGYPVHSRPTKPEN